MLSTQSGFSENVYLQAAQDRLQEVNFLLDAEPPQYVMVCYLSGVAVECLFYAYSMRAQVPNDAKHNLGIHANASGFYNGMSRKERQHISEFMGEITSRWQNNHRYRSIESLREFFTKNRLFVVDGQTTTRLDVVQFNAERLAEAANVIVPTGVRRWTI